MTSEDSTTGNMRAMSVKAPKRLKVPVKLAKDFRLSSSESTKSVVYGKTKVSGWLLKMA